MNGRAWLFSALTAVLKRAWLEEGANADAEPARSAVVRAVTSFIMVLIVEQYDGG